MGAMVTKVWAYVVRRRNSFVCRLPSAVTPDTGHRIPDTGYPVFRFGLKNGVATTRAGARRRTASTVTSISTRDPTA